MEVANVTDFASTPHFDVFEQLLPERGEVLVRVRAAAISNLVKAQAAGKHYTSGTTLPFVFGNDGVGLLPDGRHVYFLLPRAPFGFIAEETVVFEKNSIRNPGRLV